MPLLSQFRAAPNLLTLMRLFIIPFLVIAILDGHYRTAFALFILAGISDALDGLLARMLRQKTTLGQYLDPIADKLLLSTLFVVLTHVGLMPQYVTVLVFSRDVGILLISTLLFVTSALRDFRPSLFGKLNTLVQIVTLVVVLFQKAFISMDLDVASGRAFAGDCGAGTAFGGTICVDRDSEDEHAASRDCGLALWLLGSFLVEGLFFLDGDVAKLCGIKDFSAGLALNKLSVFLAGDNFDDGMFARGCHRGGLSNGKDFARLWRACQLRFI